MKLFLSAYIPGSDSSPNGRNDFYIVKSNLIIFSAASMTPACRIIAADLRRKLRWDTQSDTLWKYYYDLLRLAEKAGLKTAGIDLSKTLKRRITRKGIKGITPLEKQMVFSTGFDDPVYKEYMLKIFKSVHCGMDMGRMNSRLYDTWTARNDTMALSLTKLVKFSKGPVIAIMGGGHTEYGFGVIDCVSFINKNISQVNVSLREINIEPAGLQEYLEPFKLKGHKERPPADYIWFTHRVSWDDPCERFKKNLNK